MSLAKSSIFTQSPISSTNISPPLAIEPACITNCAASGMVIKYLVISGCVTVTGPPWDICLLNNGITLPLLPRTFPNLTATNSVLLCLSKDWIIISANLLVAPITFVGLTALSVDINTNLFTPNSSAHCATLSVPNTLFLIASTGFVSIKGTCLCAAAWKTTEGLYLSNTSRNLALSLTEAIITSKSNSSLYVYLSSFCKSYALFS